MVDLEDDDEGADLVHEPPIGGPGEPGRCPECNAPIDPVNLDHEACLEGEEHPPIEWTCVECGYSWECRWAPF